MTTPAAAVEPTAAVRTALTSGRHHPAEAALTWAAVAAAATKLSHTATTACPRICTAPIRGKSLLPLTTTVGGKCPRASIAATTNVQPAIKGRVGAEEQAECTARADPPRIATADRCRATRKCAFT